MSEGNEIHVGDIGTNFVAQMTDCGSPVDLSPATSLAICFKPPGTTPGFTRAATFASTLVGGAGDGTDGFMQYTTVTSDITISGEWEWQPFVLLPSGEFHANIKVFEVFINLDCFPQG